MKKRIGFFVLAAIIAVVGFFSMDTSKETEAISKAVYVTDGKVLPENEGKLLVVAGEFEILNPLVDELTGVELPGVTARRTVERYEKVSKTEDGKTYYTLEWKNTILGDNNEFNDTVSSRLFAGCKVGDIVIDNTVLTHISLNKKYHDIDSDVTYPYGYNVITHKDITYATKVDYMPEGGEEYKGSFTQGFNKVYYMDYENMPRISYTIQEHDTNKYTFIGKQQNGKLVYDTDFGMDSAYEGILTIDQLSEKVESGGMTGAIIAWVIAAIIALIGLLNGKKKYVPTDADMKEIEKDID